VFTEDEDYVLRGTFFDEDLLDEPAKYSNENSSSSLNTSATMTVELGRTNTLKTSLKD